MHITIPLFRKGLAVIAVIMLLLLGWYHTVRNAHPPLLNHADDVVPTSSVPPGTRLTGRIPYDTNWAYQPDASDNNFAAWFDQVPTPDAPDTPTSYNTKNQINPAVTYLTFPKQLDVRLTKIRFYDGAGSSKTPLRVSLLLTDGSEVTDVAQFYGQSYNQWIDIYTIPATQQRVKTVILRTALNGNMVAAGAYPTEIEFTGTYTSYVTPKAGSAHRVPLRNMLGSNTFPWNNSGGKPEGNLEIPTMLAKYNYMAWNRAYDDWPLFEQKEGDYRYAPTYTGGWNQDLGFARLKAKGVQTIQCLKDIPKWLIDRLPTSVGGDGHLDATRSDRRVESAHHKYRGNLVEYVNRAAFPTSGNSTTLSYLRTNGTRTPLFPYTADEPAYFIDKTTQLVYRWTGNTYTLLTRNVPGVYFSVYTAADAVPDHPSGQLRTKFNETLTADRQKPSTYIEFARLAFQSAARYGTNKHLDPHLLRTPDKQMGLNLLAGIEAGNELNAGWNGRRRYTSPFEMAALLSAFYDGHHNTLGPGVGVKNADPNMPVFMGGIVSVNPRVIRAMIDWCAQNRGYRPDGTVDICWDVIKFHQYTNSHGLEQHQSGTRYGMPADMVPLAPSRIKRMKDVSYEYLGRSLPVHIGELGYDIGPTGQQAALITDIFGRVQHTRRQSQADWAVRDMLCYNRAGADGLQFYLLQDPAPVVDPDASSNLYMSSGFFQRGDQQPADAPRLAGWYTQQFIKKFGDYTVTDILSEDPLVYKLTHGTHIAYALVVPDMVGRTGRYTLQLPGVSNATLCTLQPTGTKLHEQQLHFVDTLTVRVSETPCFITLP